MFNKNHINVTCSADSNKCPCFKCLSLLGRTTLSELIRNDGLTNICNSVSKKRFFISNPSRSINTIGHGGSFSLQFYKRKKY